MTDPARPRALVVCPGRGSYGREDLGTLARAAARAPEIASPILAALDALRAERGEPPLRAIDGAASFSPRIHLAPEHASDLIFAASAIDFARVRDEIDPVVVVGNSLGFYTALHVAGALDLEDAARLVGTMAALQKEAGAPIGGQVIYPACDEATWRPSAAHEAAIEAALARARAEGAFAARSIRLGGYEVLGGDEAGVAALLAALPKDARAARDYPLRLAGHSAFHTPLMAGIALRARERLASALAFYAPRIPLVDGRGAIVRPRIAAPRDLFEYTLAVQPVETFDFAAAMRVALREYAPQVIVALGPGDTLGGPIGQTLVREGWAGIRDRAAFKDRQASAEPILRSLGRRAESRTAAGHSAPSPAAEPPP